MRVHEFRGSEANAVNGENYNLKESDFLNGTCDESSSRKPLSYKPASDSYEEPSLQDVCSESIKETGRRIKGISRNRVCPKEPANGDNDRCEGCLPNERLAANASHLESHLGNLNIPKGYDCMVQPEKIQREKRKAGRPKKLSYVAEDDSSNSSHKRKRGRPKGWRKNPERDVYIEMIDAPCEKRNPKSVFDAVVVPLNNCKETSKEDSDNEALRNGIQSETNDHTWDINADAVVKPDSNSSDYEMEEPVPGLTFESMTTGPSSSDLPSSGEPLNIAQSDSESETNFGFSEDDFAALDKIEQDFEAHDFVQSNQFSSPDSISRKILVCEQNETSPQKGANEVMKLSRGTTVGNRKENNNIFNTNTGGKANEIGMRIPSTSSGSSKFEKKSFGNPANLKYPNFLKSPRDSTKFLNTRTKPSVSNLFASKNSNYRTKQALFKPFRPPFKKDAPFNVIDEETKPTHASSPRRLHHDNVAAGSLTINKLQSEISTLQDQISVVELANDLENNQEDEMGLLEKIQRWRRSAQLAVEVLFPVFSLKFTTMLQEIPESVLPSVVDNLRSKPCNIGTFLEQLDIPFSLLNYNPDSDSWGDEA
ncbi:Swi5 complex subunit Swi2 [Schizosaccharomyces octosporus yFS286]|uniref:Swi5 complex subunit Swi2 n=1 Tax=Schizosaccharomyces octosporus (strain yFS286) TaxID=483514 RepID=S9PYX3_SCHOY|nr:Swi5 complex subunit Swi2 [Schizosaccharomyces octosporus yFS286]EPX72628.1 Swi5 complex subunit Swi2 [Schizosaccharomyces octosporus yFS286]